MSRSRNVGPAAGDAELYNTVLVEPIMNNYTQDHDNIVEAALSEPHANIQRAVVSPVTIQHRNSLPTVWNTEAYASVRGIILQDNTRDVALETFGGTLETNNHYFQSVNGNQKVNERLIPNSSVDPHICSQCNNSMHIEAAGTASNKHRVKFADNTPTKHELPHVRRSQFTHSTRKAPDRHKHIDKGGEYFEEFGSPDGDFGTGTKDSQQNYASPKSLSYKRAKLFCCLGSGLALFLITLHLCFTLAGLILRNRCKIVASFFGRISFLSIILICLEWLKYCLWREIINESNTLQTLNINENSNGSLMGNFLQSHTGVNNSLEGNCKSSDNFANQSLSFGDPAGACDHENFGFMNERNSQIEKILKCDGKKIALTFILIVFYILVISLLIDGAIWIHKDYKESFKSSGDVTSFGIIAKQVNLSINPECTTSNLYAGLVYLYMVFTLVVIRVVLACIQSFGDSIRLFLFLCRRRHHRGQSSNGNACQIDFPIMNLGNTEFLDEQQVSGV